MAKKKKSAEEQALFLLGQVAFLQVTVRSLAYAVVRRIATTEQDFEFFKESVEKAKMPAGLPESARKGWDAAHSAFPKDYESLVKSVKEISHLH